MRGSARVRQIVLDIETTGFNPAVDRIIEIGCIELVDRRRTGNNFHAYCNPHRSVGDSFAVHGIPDAFLANQPDFPAGAFLAYIGDAQLVAHNAKFDMGFLPAVSNDVVDTLAIARHMRPGKKNSLDMLAKAYNIKTQREKHGALIDADILVDVYLALTTEQAQLLSEEARNEEVRRVEYRPTVVIYATPEDLAEQRRLFNV